MSPDIVAANLARHWNESARTGRRQRGRQWYPAARDWAESLARETGYTLEQVVAVLAITSPGIQLTSNLDHTERIMRGERDSGGRFPNVNRPKIAAVLTSPDAAAEWARGPKVGPFHRAILGDSDALVLDRWAIYAATGDASKGRTGHTRDAADDQLTRGRREVIEDAYRALARKVRIPVRDLQATIWLQVRETTGAIRGGQVRSIRYADITA